MRELVLLSSAFLSLCSAKSYLYEVQNEIILDQSIDVTDSNLCQIRLELEEIVCDGFSSCDVILDDRYDTKQCSDFDPVTVAPTTTTTTAVTTTTTSTSTTSTVSTTTTTAKSTTTSVYNPPERPPYPVPMEVIMDVGWSYLGLNVVVCFVILAMMLCIKNNSEFRSCIVNIMILVFILSTIGYMTVFVYNITDADAHFNDRISIKPAATRTLESNTLNFITAIVSSQSSKQVIDAYNDNLSSQKPTWLESDFTKASLSDIQIEENLNGVEIGLITLFSIVAAILLGLVCYTCRQSWTRSIVILSAFLLFAAISTVTILMVRNVRDVTPSVDFTIGIIMITVFFIMWLILMGSFYIAIRKPEVQKVSSSTYKTSQIPLESVIPAPPRYPPPTVNPSKHKRRY